ncbi:hypothetical protein KY289_036389 [Solanum tuberosum]|nr:hypothetical protein KY289_036389 [Solanum tuberosum]
MTPDETWSRKRLAVDQFRTFGCIAYAHIPDQKRKKLDDNEKCILLSWNKNSIGEQIPVYLDGESNEKAIQPQHQVPTVAQDASPGCSETSPVMDEQIETIANCRAPRVRRRPSWMTDYMIVIQQILKVLSKMKMEKAMDDEITA